MESIFDIDNYIEIQYRSFAQVKPESQWDLQYEQFYRNIQQKSLRKLLTVFHAELTNLFNMMNGRLPTGAECGAHFWAEPSRELISVINGIRALHRVLKETNLAFTIDDYYDTLLENCSQWLSVSGGSEIPPNTDKVVLYYKKPIFISEDGMSMYQDFHELGERGKLLGRGGFGEVFQYKHPIVDIDFAIKLFNPIFSSDEDKEEGEKRFFREAKMLFKLNHPNIVRIYDVGKHNGRAFIKIEFVKGKTLEAVRNDYGNLPFNSASRAIMQILEGMQHAHDNEIIHRDLKPSNIMVDTTDEKWVCKIIDFGISAFMETDGYTKLTKTGEHIAGGNYIDPLLQEDPTLRDVRSDIYSISAILYFLLCGRPPVGGDIEWVLRESNRSLTNEQVQVVLKSLSIDINKRFSTCLEMKEAIQELI